MGGGGFFLALALALALAHLCQSLDLCGERETNRRVLQWRHGTQRNKKKKKKSKIPFSDMAPSFLPYLPSRLSPGPKLLKSSVDFYQGRGNKYCEFN